MLSWSPTRKLPFLIIGLCAAQMSWSSENPNRDLYWGDLQVRTAWSNKAFVHDVRIDPQAAYRYARGEAVEIFNGSKVQLTKPLDFVAVADDSDYLGVAALANTEASDVARLWGAKNLRPKRGQALEKIYPAIEKELMSEQLPHSTLRSAALTRSIWQQYLAVTDHFNQPGQFTTLPAFSWSSRLDTSENGRVIIFADSKSAGERPMTGLAAPRIDKLYDWFDDLVEKGAQAVAIPYGLAHDAVEAKTKTKKLISIDDDEELQRSRNELSQMAMYGTGSRETLSLLSPVDEFADFEVGLADLEHVQFSNYIRNAYLTGIANQDSRGFNPFRFGLIAGSGTYNGIAQYPEAAYLGHLGNVDATPQLRLSEENKLLRQYSAGGLTAVWATQNTREALFGALRKNETYMTSGPRIKLRLFAGWSFPENPFNRPDWVKAGYENGVPMGGILLDPPRDASPQFMIYAEKDPDSAKLDRVQIVKGWTHNGQVFQKIYDVVWSGDRKIDNQTGKLKPVGNTVNIAKAQYTNTIGADRLLKVWKDPDFDPRLHAVYYARALEIPTPRWTTYDAVKIGVAPPADVPSVIQERAITTPVWYQPSAAERQNFKPGLTVAELLQAGANLLDDKTLEKMFVGKTIRIRNLVSGQFFEVKFAEDGQRTLLSVDGEPVKTLVSMDPMFDIGVKKNESYSIRDQKVALKISGKLFYFSVYADGGRYVIASAQEFGYANYVVEKHF